MVAQQKVDPRWKFLNELDIYRLVKIEMRDPDWVGQRVEMDSIQVCQLVARMTATLVAQAPTAEDPEETQRRKRFAEQVAAERIHLCYRMALQCFRRSLGDVTTTREVSRGGARSAPVVYTRSSCGQTKYLEVAVKFAVMLRDLPTPMMDEAFLAEFDEYEDVAPMPESPSGPAEQDENHPKEACSETELEKSREFEKQAVGDSVKSAAIKACIDGLLARRAAEDAESRPVQPSATEPTEPTDKRKKQARRAFLSGAAGP